MNDDFVLTEATRGRRPILRVLARGSPRPIAELLLDEALDLVVEGNVRLLKYAEYTLTPITAVANFRNRAECAGEVSTNLEVAVRAERSDIDDLVAYVAPSPPKIKVRASAHRDQPDRSIVITRIGRS